MINNGPAKKRTTTRTKHYNENGFVEWEEIVEEVEYETASNSVWPNGQWWQNPVISYGSNTQHKDHVHIDPDLI